MSDTATGNDVRARGVLLDQSEGRIVLGLPGTDYQIHLVATGEVKPAFTGRIVGELAAKARRVDRTQGGRGGRYFEPVYGRPRRVQGRVIAVHGPDNAITVVGACPIRCTLTANQRAADFKIGEFVTFDVEPGATFTQVEG